MSAYTDKALRNNGLYLKTYNNPCDWFNTAYNTTLTFPQFVDCIIEKAERHSSLMSSRHSGIYLDHHWAPQSHLSLPCRANYTFIGKQDHFQDNTRFMVERLKLNVTLTRENSSSRLEKSLEFWYRQLTSKAKRKLQALYKYDFLLFGFDQHLLVVKTKMFLICLLIHKTLMFIQMTNSQIKSNLLISFFFIFAKKNLFICS